MSIVTETVEFDTGATRLAAFLARPDLPGRVPSLVVVHEAFGLTDDIRGIARRLAGQGYAALAVDLFAGRNQVVCMFRYFAGMLTNALGHSGIHDLRSALDYLSAQPYADPARLGAVGFCLGGNLTVCLACADQRVKVVAPFYGLAPRPIEALRRSCPVVGSYPDPDFTTASGRQLQAALQEFNIEHDVKIYPGATHSFFNGRPGPANAAAAEDAWVRLTAFFSRHLAPQSPD